MTDAPKLSKLRLTIIGLVFVTTVAIIAAYTEQLIIPLFLGLLTWGKAWLKTLTPKLGLLLLKNGLVIQLRRMIVGASTHVFLKSHRVHFVRSLLSRYLSLPLWMKSVLAMLVLLATAGSSFAVFALLVIPQPVLSWLRNQVMGLLNKLGVTQIFGALWRFIIPTRLRERWYMYAKWTLGRQQVNAAKKIHNNLANRKSRLMP